MSPEVRDEGLALHIGRPRQYTVIGEPVDMRARRHDFGAARAAARAALKLPPDADVIGWVGRFAAQKDPRTLADVLSRVLLERHNAYAVLVGDGPDRALVESLLRPEAAERRVRFTGERDDVRELYPAFDVLLHTSRWEGHPRVVREALAERVPVVTARVAGTDVVSSDIRVRHGSGARERGTPTSPRSRRSSTPATVARRSTTQRSRHCARARTSPTG